MPDELPLIPPRALTPEEISKAIEISEDWFTVFSNHIRIAASATEFRLFFGDNYPTATGQIRIIESFNVVVPPLQAKQMMQLLAATIQNYEKVFGVIPSAPEQLAKAQLATAHAGPPQKPTAGESKEP